MGVRPLKIGGHRMLFISDLLPIAVLHALASFFLLYYLFVFLSFVDWCFCSLFYFIGQFYVACLLMTPLLIFFYFFELYLKSCVVLHVQIAIEITWHYKLLARLIVQFTRTSPCMSIFFICIVSDALIVLTLILLVAYYFCLLNCVSLAN